MHTFAQSPLTVAVETLGGRVILSAGAETVAVELPAPLPNLPDETPGRRLSDVEITPLISAIQYRFRAPGHASLLLKYRSATENGTMTVCAGEDYWYEGILPFPFTYNNSNVILTVADLNNLRLWGNTLRTGYPATQPPQQAKGKLSGITVCIDPGHQETARTATEARGPGLGGMVESGVGMAHGAVTRRMESIVALEIGFVLRDALVKEGAAVVMTRTAQDVYLSNIERAGIAAEANADVFLRLHCNQRDNTSVRGIGVFCPYGSDYARVVADTDGWREMGEILLRAMQ